MGIQLCINGADFRKNCVNKLDVWNHSLDIVQGSTGWSLQNENLRRLSPKPGYKGIFIPANGSIIISGLLSGPYPLKADYVYYTTNEIPITIYEGSEITTSATNAVGTGSNYNTSNYFPLNNDGSSDSIIISNTYNQDYYFVPVFASAGNSSSDQIPSDSYNLTWRYS